MANQLVTTPFEKGTPIVGIEAGQLISEIIVLAKIPEQMWDNLVVTVNGISVNSDNWNKVRLIDSDVMRLFVIPLGGGGGGKTILRLVAIIAVAIAAPYIAGAIAPGLAGAAAGTAGAAGYSALVAGITIVGTLAINALIPPPSLDLISPTTSSVGNNYYLTGQTNRARFYEIVPIVYGSHKMIANLATSVDILNAGSSSIFSACYDFGLGGVHITDLKAGDTDLAVLNAKTALYVRHPRHKDVTHPEEGLKPIKLSLVNFPTKHTELAIGLSEKYNPGDLNPQPGAEGESTTATECREAVIELTYPNGMVSFADDGTTNPVRVDYKLMYRKTGATIWRIPEAGVEGYDGEHLAFTRKNIVGIEGGSNSSLTVWQTNLVDWATGQPYDRDWITNDGTSPVVAVQMSTKVDLIDGGPIAFRFMLNNDNDPKLVYDPSKVWVKNPPDNPFGFPVDANGVMTIDYVDDPVDPLFVYGVEPEFAPGYGGTIGEQRWSLEIDSWLLHDFNGLPFIEEVISSDTVWNVNMNLTSSPGTPPVVDNTDRYNTEEGNETWVEVTYYRDYPFDGEYYSSYSNFNVMLRGIPYANIPYTDLNLYRGELQSVSSPWRSSTREYRKQYFALRAAAVDILDNPPPLATVYADTTGDGGVSLQVFDPIEDETGEPEDIIYGFNVRGDAAQAGIISILIVFEQAGQYDIRIERWTRNRQSTKQVDACTWSKLVSRGNTQDNDQYTLLNLRKQHTLLELRFEASDNIQGNVQQISAIAHSQLRTYNGSWQTPVETANPAWIVLDILTGYSIQNHQDVPPYVYSDIGWVKDEQIDFQSFIDLATLCDETIEYQDYNGDTVSRPRYECNMLLASDASIMETCQSILSMCRAQLTVNQAGLISILIDSDKGNPAVPRQLFTPQNSWGFSGNRVFQETPHAFNVTFTAPELGYNIGTVTVYQPGYDSDNAELYEDLSTYGVTNWHQASLYGMYMLAQGVLRSELFTITCDVENLVVSRGHLVHVQNDVPLLGGVACLVERDATTPAIVYVDQILENYEAMSGEWGREPDGVAPTDGGWSSNTADTVLRINWIDNDSVDRQLDLQVPIDTVFVFTQITDPGRTDTFTVQEAPVQGAGYTEYVVTHVSTGGGVLATQDCTLEATKPVGYTHRAQDGTIRHGTVESFGEAMDYVVITDQVITMLQGELLVIGTKKPSNVDGQVTDPYLITQIEPGANLTAQITMVRYDPEIYKDDWSTFVSWSPSFGAAASGETSLYVDGIQGFAGWKLIGDQPYSTTLLTWEILPVTVAASTAFNIISFQKDSGGTPIEIITLDGDVRKWEHEYYALDPSGPYGPGTYTITPVSNLGYRGEAQSVWVGQITDGIAPPMVDAATLGALPASNLKGYTEFSWEIFWYDPGLGFPWAEKELYDDARYFIISKGPAGATEPTEIIAQVPYNVINIVDKSVPPNQSYFDTVVYKEHLAHEIFIQCVDTTGNQSEAEQLSFVPQAPPAISMPGGKFLEITLQGVDTKAEWADGYTLDTDVDYFMVYFNPDTAAVDHNAPGTVVAGRASRQDTAMIVLPKGGAYFLVVVSTAGLENTIVMKEIAGVPMTQADVQEWIPAPVAVSASAAEKAAALDDGEWISSRRTKYFPDGFVNGQVYYRGDEVSNGSQISEAIVDGATESPFIEPTGEDTYAYLGTIGQQSDTVKQVVFGARYVMEQSGYLTGYRVYLDTNVTYSIFVVINPEGDRIVRQVATIPSTTTGWVEETSQSVIVEAGLTFDLAVVAFEGDPVSTDFTYNWDYDTPQNTVVPASGTIVHANSSADFMRVSKNDADGFDRSADLALVVVGDHISANGVLWTVQSVIDETTYVQFAVAPATQASPDGVAAFTFEVVVAAPIITAVDLDWWLSNQPPFATVQGLFGINTGLEGLVPNNDARGIDAKFQAAYVPTEWQVKVLAGGSAGGGGDFTPTLFTGAGSSGYVPDPLTEDNKRLSDDGSWLPNTIDNLTDVEITAPKANHGLWWDAVNQKWVNGAAFEESWPTGLVDGGELNIDVSQQIEVITGIGVISDTYTDPQSPPALIGVRWDQINEPITAAPAVAGSAVWFSIYNSGVPSDPPIEGGVQVFEGEVRQYPTGPTPSLAKREVFLGVAIHNGVEWKEVSNPKVVNQAAETLREIAITLLPVTTIIQGGATHSQPTFEIRQDEGTVWEQNRNWHNDKSDPNRETLPLSDPIVFQYVNRDFTDVGSPLSTVDPGMWDDAGSVVPVTGTANTATIQRLYLDPANNYWMLWGQNLYENFQAAFAGLSGDSQNTVVPYILQNSILLGYSIAEHTKADWNQDEAIWSPNVANAQGGGGGGTPVTDHGNLSGLGDDDHTQYLNNARGDLRYTPIAHETNYLNPHQVTYAQLPDKPTIITDHGELSGLGDDDHTQYLNNGRGDLRYTPLAHETDYLNPHQVTYAQLPDKPTIVTDHAGLSGLDADDHLQYHTDERGDLRYTPLAHETNYLNPHQVTYDQLPDKPTIVNDHGGLTGLSDDDHPQYLNESRGDGRYTPLSHLTDEDNPHSTTFLKLDDTPIDYTGYAGEFVTVHNGETGLAFTDVPDDGVTYGRAAGVWNSVYTRAEIEPLLGGWITQDNNFTAEWGKKYRCATPPNTVTLPIPDQASYDDQRPIYISNTSAIANQLLTVLPASGMYYIIDGVSHPVDEPLLLRPSETARIMPHAVGASYDLLAETMGAFAGANSRGFVPDPVTESGRYLSDGGTWQNLTVIPAGGIRFEFVFSSNTAVSAPSSGGVKVNNINGSLATIMSFSDLTINGNTVQVWAEQLREGDFLGIVDEVDGISYYYTVDGVVTDHTTWWEVPIAVHVVEPPATPIPNGSPSYLAMIGNPKSRMPNGGALDEVLAKASGNDYDTKWVDLDDKYPLDNVPTDGYTYGRYWNGSSYQWNTGVVDPVLFRGDAGVGIGSVLTPYADLHVQGEHARPSLIVDKNEGFDWSALPDWAGIIMGDSAGYGSLFCVYDQEADGFDLVFGDPATSAWKAGIGKYSSTDPTRADEFNFWQGDDAAMTFTLGSVRAMTMLPTSGNVGIGTTSPVYPLVVSNAGGAGYECAPSTASGFVRHINYNRSGAAYVQGIYDASELLFRTNGTAERMRIDSAGNVGIGTTNPLQKLDVSASQGAVIQIKSTISTIAEGSPIGALQWYTMDGSSGGTGVAANITLMPDDVYGVRTNMFLGARGGADSGGRSQLQLWGRNGRVSVGVNTSEPTNTFTVAGTGYFSGSVGVGISNPAYKLDVNAGAVNTAARILTTTNICDLRLEDLAGHCIIRSNQGSMQFNVNNAAQTALGLTSDGKVRCGSNSTASFNATITGRDPSGIGNNIGDSSNLLELVAQTNDGTANSVNFLMGYERAIDGYTSWTGISQFINFSVGTNQNTTGGIRYTRPTAGTANAYMTFHVGVNTERVRIDSSGRAMFGTTVPAGAGGSINIAAGANYYIDGTPISTFVDAPSDGNLYARKNAAWSSIGAGAGTVSDLESQPAATQVVIDNTGGLNATILGATESLAGVMTSADKIKLDDIEPDANDYTHPTKTPRTSSVDSGLLSGATVISDIDMNLSSDSLGHVTSSGMAIATRELTLANLGYTGDPDANDYIHPTHPGDDFSVDTGPMSGPVVVSDIDINVSSDSEGHVTDANGIVSSRVLTLADLSYTGDPDANNYVHPSYTGRTSSVDSGALTGATIISDIDMNLSSDGEGHVTSSGMAIATRELTADDIGATDVKFDGWAFTPTFNLGGSTSGTVVVTQLGNLLILSGRISWTTPPTSTSNLYIEGLPYACTYATGVGMSCREVDNNVNAGNGMMMTIEAGASRISLWGYNENGLTTAKQGNHLGSNGYIDINITYYAQTAPTGNNTGHTL